MDLPVNWTNKYKQNWDEAWKRMEAWWHCEETDRPLVFSSVPKPVSERKGKIILPQNPDEAARFDLDYEVKLNNTRYFLENTLFLAEAVPYAYTDYARLLGMLCVQAGGRISYSVDPYNASVNAWMQREDDLFDREPPQVLTPCKELEFALEMINRNHNTFGFDVVLGASPMLDPMTTLSLMRGTEDFLADLIEREDDVMRWLKRLGEFHRQAISGYREARAALGRREDFGWTGAWCPGDMDAIQCDVSTMISQEMFRKFALPEMEYEASFYDYTIWHLDGTDEFRHIDDICSIPNINAIQFVDGKRRDLTEFSDIWKKILKYGKSLLFSCDPKLAVSLTKELGPRGIAFNSYDIKTEGEMEKFLKSLVI